MLREICIKVNSQWAKKMVMGSIFGAKAVSTRALSSKASGKGQESGNPKPAINTKVNTKMAKNKATAFTTGKTA